MRPFHTSLSLFFAITLVILLTSVGAAPPADAQATLLSRPGAAVCVPGGDEIPNCVPPPRGMEAWWPFDDVNTGRSGEFIDIAQDHDGLARFAPRSIEGRVSRAASFVDPLDAIFVNQTAGLDFGAGQDFTIDFWIRTIDQGGVEVVLEKRVFDPGARGYQVFTFDGRVGLQMGTGVGSNFCSFDNMASACTNYVSTTEIADGEWHFIAITVDRDSSQGVRFYVDGQLSGSFNATVRNASLVNDAPLQIGNGDRDAGFSGDLDELEIYRRALADSEVQDLFNAGAGGKCKAVVDAPWDRALCRTDDAVLPEITLCNRSTDDRVYDLAFAGLPPNPPGVLYGNLCEVSGPTQFQLQGGGNPVMVPAGECVTRVVRIPNPPSLEGQPSCYRVTATEQATGAVLTDAGLIPAVNRVCPRPHRPVVLLPLEGTAVAEFWFEDFQEPDVLVRAEFMGPAFEGEGPPPVRVIGEPEREVRPGADGRALVQFEVESVEASPMEAFELVLATDAGGEQEFLSSVAVFPSAEPCVDGLGAVCLVDDRFEVTTRWRTPQGTEGAGQAVSLTEDTGYFWFFDADNVELIVKILDVCIPPFDRFWVFAGGLTNVEVELTVRDTVTGAVKTYTNELGEPFQPIQDTNAFTCP